jgi:beta-lactamase regulating signal transducer with metallopeptidase domain
MLNTLIEYGNSEGDRWAAWVVTTSVDTAVLLALFALLWLAIRKRVAPQVGYCLFLLVPLKLLVPFEVAVPSALANLTPSAVASSCFVGARDAAGVASRPLREQLNVAGADELPASVERAAAVAHSLATVVPVDSERSLRSIEARSAPNTVSSGRAPAHSATDSPRPSLTAIAMLAWLGGVVVLFAKLARAQWRFRTSVAHSSRLDAARLPVGWRELCRRAGCRQSIEVVENDGVTAPAVWGIFRPRIILPRGIIASFPARQMRWLLLHELAHIGRRDLAVVALQRFTAILHFFNPAIWISNRIIHRLREYACDDLAVSLGDVSGVESGEAFLHILRHADHGRRGLDGALGVFGLDSRSSCFLRVHRLLDTERPVRTSPGAWSLMGLILLAIVSLPHLRTAQSETSSQQTQETATDPVPDKTGMEFELHVVGPDGKPVPEAIVHIRTSPAPTANWIRHGKFVRHGSYGAFLSADGEGRLALALPRVPTDFDVDITTPGFGPYWASWSSNAHDEAIPRKFTAQLEAGWSIGGIIVDASGKPVEGVQIRPFIEYKKRPGYLGQMGIGTTLRTDAAGKWQFDSVPASMAEIEVGIDHPDFKPGGRRLARGGFEIEKARLPAAKVVLDRGITVSGKVSDEAGNPIAQALVRTKFVNDIREARTGNDGVYRLGGCEPRAVRIVVSAKGRATDMRELNIEPEMGPVDFQMKPGGTVRIRVLDADDKPVSKARIFFQRWRGQFSYFEFNHVSQYADENGVWEWKEAPLDEFNADICPPDGMELELQPLVARAEAYVFRTAPALVVSGKVVDAVTKNPIKKFRVVPGFRSAEKEMHWRRSENYVATLGNYRLRRTRADFDQIRIEADGYNAATSRDIKSSEGNVSIDFELTRGKNVVARVFTPRNLPAVGAQVALGVAGSQINIKNGDIADPSIYCAREATDLSGRFHFPAQDKNFELVITHPSGFAHVKSAPEWDLTKIIHLEPWARVEGTFRIGKALAPSVPITLDVARLHGNERVTPRFYIQYESATGPDGRFVFERVIPGKGRIGRRLSLTVDTGATEVTSVYTIPAEFLSGTTNQVDLGGTGRAVVGKLRPPDGFKEKVRWNFALVTVRSAAAEPNANSPQFTATVDLDGKFRIDDVRAGDYSLAVDLFQGVAAGGLQGHRFTVPRAEDDRSSKPVDLGTLTLK